jgi:cupin superfamily acireductone dioxygenase involved in methionine salvage
MVPDIVAAKLCAINKDNEKQDCAKQGSIEQVSAKQDFTKEDSVKLDSVNKNQNQDELPKVRSCNAALTNVQCSD